MSETDHSHLLRVLERVGVQRLYEGRTEISGLCPCGCHPKPCWSIHKTTLEHRCFNCGYSGTLRELLTLQRVTAHQLLDDVLNCEDIHVVSFTSFLLTEVARLRDAGRN